jgi:nucleoside 2-deoxyribosyltransferase
MKKLVYLSGMMDGVSAEEGKAWRKKATEFLREHGFDTYNPYDGEEYEDKTNANEIAHRDIYYLDKCDIVLANLDLPETLENKKIPFFTIGEMFLANRQRKPVVAYTNCLKGRPGYDFVVTKSFKNLEDSLDYIVANYL